MKKLDLKSKKILGFGEVMLRLTPNNYNKVIQADSFNSCYAGAEANVINSLSVFGHKSKFLTKVPNNSLGKKVKQTLASNFVDIEHVIECDGRLGIYFLEIGYGMRSSEVLYDRKYSCISFAKMEDFDFDYILNDVGLIHVSGITPALSESLKEITFNLIKIAKSKNIIISFDFNYRQKLWSKDEAGDYYKKVLPYLDVVFLSEKDVRGILKIDIEKKDDYKEDLNNIFHYIKNKYPNIKYIACTNRTVNSINNNTLKGYLYDGENLYYSKDYTFDILDRVGGGDSYTAGILHSLIKGMDYQMCVDFASLASVLKHSINGDINVIDESSILSILSDGLTNIKR